jgi:hypothetical protein
MFVDGVDQAQFPGQEMEGADAAAVDGVSAIRDFVLDVTGTEHGLGANNWSLGLIEPTLDATLAILEPTCENGFHLKSFGGLRGLGGWLLPQTPENAGGFQAFSRITKKLGRALRLFKD